MEDKNQIRGADQFRRPTTSPLQHVRRGPNGSPVDGRPAAHVPNMHLITCPACQGTGRNPEAPAAIADDDGTCLVCCYPLHPWYAAWHGQIRVPVNLLVVAAEAQLRQLCLAGLDDIE